MKSEKVTVVKKSVVDVLLRFIIIGALATAGDVLYNKTLGKKFNVK